MKETSERPRWFMALNELETEETARKGAMIYERVRQSLEPAQSGQFIAVHVDSGEYVTARSTAAAMRSIRQRHETGPLYLRKIGDEPEYGLAARLLAGEMAGSRK